MKKYNPNIYKKAAGAICRINPITPAHAIWLYGGDDWGLHWSLFYSYFQSNNSFDSKEHLLLCLFFMAEIVEQGM